MLSELQGWCQMLVSRHYSLVLGTIEGDKILQDIPYIFILFSYLLSLIYSNNSAQGGPNSNFSVREAFQCSFNEPFVSLHVLIVIPWIKY